MAIEMLKKLPLTLCLLTGVIFSGTIVRAAIQQRIVQSGITEPANSQIIAQQTSLSAATLTVEDLPTGFQQLPPVLVSQFAGQFEAFSQQLALGNLNPENFFAFVNPATFQVVLGFTGDVPEQSEQMNFDTNIQKLNDPQTQEQMVDLLTEKLKEFGGVQIENYASMPEMKTVADASAGMTMLVNMQGQPLRLDIASFRRNDVVVFTGVLYPNEQESLVQVGDLVKKLDKRIVNTR